MRNEKTLQNQEEGHKDLLQYCVPPVFELVAYDSPPDCRIPLFKYLLANGYNLDANEIPRNRDAPYVILRGCNCYLEGLFMVLWVQKENIICYTQNQRLNPYRISLLQFKLIE